MLALDLENLPDPPPAAIAGLLVGVVLAWLALRVAILRRRLAEVAPGEPPPASAFLLVLARSRASLPVLVLLIGACAVAVVLAFGWR